ncbi:transcription-repair coupling factor [Candidatus Microgenomates bacterium]|nr:transcription-repair coupling factor [Candidatus Microgenomates bacterium]
MHRQNIFLDSVHSSIFSSEEFVQAKNKLTLSGEVSCGELGYLAKALLLSAIISTDWQSAAMLVADRKKIDFYENIFQSIGFDDHLIFTEENKPKILSLEAKPRFVILSAEDILSSALTPDEYLAKIITLTAGKKLPNDFSKKLINLGYEKVKKVNRAGEFSFSGDIWEIGTFSGVFRLELFGFNLEKIFFYAFLSGQNNDLLRIDTKEQKKKITIAPLAVGDGNGLVWDFLADHLLFIDGRENINMALTNWLDLATNKKLAISASKFFSNQKKVFLETFLVSEKEGINFSWFAPQKYNRALASFFTEVKNDIKSKKVFILSSEKEKIEKLLTHHNVPFVSCNETGMGVRVFEGSAVEGVDAKSASLKIFTDEELFGLKKKKKKVKFSALTNLKIGEHIVHVDHGIGKFTGFGTITVDNISREYIFIEYNKGDKIYVPLDQADKITKYITVGNQPPNLSSLSSGQWLKIRSKVEKNVEQIAKNLLETQAMREDGKDFSYIDDASYQKKIANTFHYKVTPDQEKAIEDILENMKEKKPMDRILVGDVGYGKTEVAVRAALRAVVSGGQVAILVPTTILAEQHAQTFIERLSDFGIKIESLSRFTDRARQKKILDRLKMGGVDIVIGTHRLLSPDVKFKKLMLVVIDEEQKFGVKDKEKLKALRRGVDILTMTATPIPRTLYFGLSSLKDISLIATPPEGRKPIKTMVARYDDEIIKEVVNKEIARGGQIYFVHNRVETIIAYKNYLQRLLPKVKIAIGHGQMSEKDLARAINDFAAGKYDMLLCSTIIESGLDISSVNTLIIDRSTHLGLAQLHQLRGRIGRGAVQAFAYFLYKEEDLRGNAEKRLKSIVEKGELGSGYELSLEDLDIRGSGNILGQEQHGSMQMVGVGYYMRLLEEAVERIRDNKSKNISHDFDIKIDLPLSAFIPDDFYKGSNEGESEKIRAYQNIADAEDEDDLAECLDKFKKNKAEIPAEIYHLLDVAKIKIRARAIGLKSVITKDLENISGRKNKKLYLDFDHILSRDEIHVLFLVSADWHFGNTQAKIDLERLGRNNDWLPRFLTILDRLKDLAKK